ncbi:MAG TPA: glycoside hydrolase family 2 TIM barrel-domain containing protein [Phycisphaerae bacterium]|nr:glycoside hydrolase family 2 TIM barrel-domain containing protein [Phycisphaerae bacterium]
MTRLGILARTFFIFIFIGLASLVSGVLSAQAATNDVSVRQCLSMDNGWSFHFGVPGDDEITIPTRYLQKSGYGFHGVDGNIQLPNDWAISLTPNPKALPWNAFAPLGPKFPTTSIGWYGRTFAIPAVAAGRRFWIEFDGVFRNSEVWVNGHYLGQHESGYTSFQYDITDLVNPGQKNDIVVRVDAMNTEGWWYEGAGIYRHVWLVETDPIAVAPNGVFVYTRFKNNIPQDQADVFAEVTVENKTEQDKNVIVRCSVLDPQSLQVAQISGNLYVPFDSDATVKLSTIVDKPGLWSPESPMLYTLVTDVESEEETTDRVVTPFGFRTIQFDPHKGFLLNGKPYLIKGVCLHQDTIGVGTAMPESIYAYHLKLLKNLGCNAIRCSHNMQAPEFLDLCDRMGFLVMAETRAFDSTPYALDQLRTLIVTDRNHPSIFIWSMGNEETASFTPLGGRVTRTMVDLAHQLDPTRLTTFASNSSQLKSTPNTHEKDKGYIGANSQVDVRGWNYHEAPQSEAYHAAHPDQPEIITEEGSGHATRGEYFPADNSGFDSSYHLATWWVYVATHPWMSGGFYWTGFDYRGEAKSWPNLWANYGIMDICGFPKDYYYYYKSLWVDTPVLHLMPHWNWPNMVGKNIPVRAYTNCDTVELFLNGQSLGKRSIDLTAAGSGSYGSWNVIYEPGKLSALGYKNGKLVADDVVETTSAPAALKLTVDRAAINADGSDTDVINVAVVDSQGRTVPTADNLITFNVSGVGRVMAVGNGDPTDHDSQTADHFKAFNGLAQLIVRSEQTPGSISVVAESPGLKPDQAVVQTLLCPLEPTVPAYKK